MNIIVHFSYKRRRISLFQRRVIVDFVITLQRHVCPRKSGMGKLKVHIRSPTIRSFVCLPCYLPFASYPFFHNQSFSFLLPATMPNISIMQSLLVIMVDPSEALIKYPWPVLLCYYKAVTLSHILAHLCMIDTLSEMGQE